MADPLRGTHTDTASQLQAILPDPSVELTSTAPLYLADPTFYYFPIDGRINAAGAEAFARLLIEENVANPDS